MVSLYFIAVYILGGITFIPTSIALIVTTLYIYNQLCRLLSLDKEDNSSFQSLETTLQEKGESNNTNDYLYKVGWLKVSREEEQENTDNNSNSSIGDMVKSYISGNKHKRETSNIYFAVLKYSTLYLYDSEKQLDCKGVIILKNYTVKTHPPGLQDFELFSKPNLIKLSSTTENYFINCNRCIDKEDWYFILIKASKLDNKQQKRDKTYFDQTAMNNLITTVHSDEHHFQTQWFNAILGRLFFGVYKTNDIKDSLYKKVMSKLDKINSKRPPFLGEISVVSVNPGHSLPRFTQPKLLGLDPTGELTAEAYIEYDGEFNIEISTKLKWKYSDRLKPFTIDLILGITLEKIQGKILLKIKEHPTNRFWYGFYECPKMEWKVEPVVWEKRIGYSVVVKAIQQKIQEFIMETMVLPNFDDITFFPTNGAGGIFEEEPIMNNDEALLTTAKSLPELFSAAAAAAQPLLSKLRTIDTIEQESTLLYHHQQYQSSAPTILTAATAATTTPRLIPTTTTTNTDASFLSSSPDSLSSSPSSSTLDDSLRTLTQVLTDETNIIVSPSTSSTITTTCDTQRVIRKSSSLALLHQKTGASTAINISPAMAQRFAGDQNKKDIDSVSVAVVSL